MGSAQHHSPKMDSKLVFPAALLVLLSLIQSGSSLQCHQCNSYTDAHCGDPFYHADDALKTPKTMDFLKDCEEGETFCRKIYQNVRGDERVIRSCGSIKDEREGDGAHDKQEFHFHCYFFSKAPHAHFHW